MEYDLKKDIYNDPREISEQLLECRDEYSLYLSDREKHKRSRDGTIMLLGSLTSNSSEYITKLGKHLGLADLYLSRLTQPHISSDLNRERFLRVLSKAELEKKDLVEILSEHKEGVPHKYNFPQYGEGSLAFEQK